MRALCLLLLASLPVRAAGLPQAHLSKQDGLFLLTGRTTLPGSLQDALPLIRDFAAYPDWSLKDINRRPRGGDYFVKIDGLEYRAEDARLRIRASLSSFFKGRYALDLTLSDRLGGAPARVDFRLANPSALVSLAEGSVVFTPSGDGAFSVEFSAKARTHWVFYYLAPMRILKRNAEDRLVRVFLNAEEPCRARTVGKR